MSFEVIWGVLILFFMILSQVGHPAMILNTASSASTQHFNGVRPHSAIGNKPPITLVERSGTHGPT